MATIADLRSPQPRQIVHIDMDAFFASVEQRDNPSLRGKPVLVGGMHRGVVAAASYEARRFGIRSAMPMAQALRLCPQAVVVRPEHGRYSDVSAQVFAIFARYTPLVEGLSFDEAFLDVTESRLLFGPGEVIARRIKEDIRRELELTASAGVAPCKFVAKIASDLRKPDGLVVVPQAEVEAFLAPLPIERMWGVGPKAAQRLRAAGYVRIGQLATAPADLMEAMLGSWGLTIIALARGIDPRPVEPEVEAKSVGAEDTFPRDLTDQAAVLRHILQQSGRVARRLTRQQMCGRVVVLKVKFADFSVCTRRVTLPAPVADTDAIYAAAKGLLGRISLPSQGVRLTGVAVADLLPGPPPRTLFPDPLALKRQRLEHVVMSIRTRFDGACVTRATLLEEDD